MGDLKNTPDELMEGGFQKPYYILLEIMDNSQTQGSNGEKKQLRSCLEHPPPCFLESFIVRGENIFLLENITEWKSSHFAIVFHQHFKSNA